MGDKQKTAVISYKIIGPSPPSRLIVPSPVKVQYLRKTIAENASLPIEKLRLILRGNALTDNKNGVEEFIQLNDGDSLIVAVKPKSPVRYVQDESSEEDDEDDLKFQVSQLKKGWQRTLFFFLRHKLRIPGKAQIAAVLLVAIFSLTLKTWAIIALWFTLAPIAHKWEVGPLYILATGFAVIFLNLGKRQQGDVSAYSIFNEDFRELPGTFNAERVDRDIRTGQF